MEIRPKNIVIDVLTMTISSEPEGAIYRTERPGDGTNKYHVRTVLGVSNISFGLPYRPAVNSVFYALPCKRG